jgi:hypothetical protein
MRPLPFSVLLLLSIADPAGVQAAGPQVRPALIGNGPKALINRIDTKKLIQKGQGDGLLFFTCYVGASGVVGNYLIYRDTLGAELLKKEVGDALRACRFIPAIYNGARTDVMFSGTVVFRAADGRPHLRIYCNQNRDDVAKENDFIAPQVIYNTPDWVLARDDPALGKARTHLQNGALLLSITVDANGNQRAMKVVLEDPPGFGFSEDFRKTFATAKWIPGFRNGRPVDCTFDYNTYLKIWYMGVEHLGLGGR